MKKGLIFGALAAVAGAAYLVKKYRSSRANDHTNARHASSRHYTDVFSRAKEGNHHARVTG